MKNVLSITALLIVMVSSSHAQDTVQVKTGWNIIGSVKAGAVPDVLTTDPPGIITTAFFGYDPGAGYASTDTLGKGLGYWVKVSADGIVIFEGTPFTGCGVKRVDYGGISYGTVQIGDQCWLAANLNVGVMVTGVTSQTNNATTEKYCYSDDPVNCGVYGGLYQWDEATQYVTTEGAQGVCPAGWHIPTYAEFQTFSSTVGEYGNALKQGGVGTGEGVGTNTSGFSALLAGLRSFTDGGFYDLGFATYIWSSTESAASDAYYLRLYDYANLIYLRSTDKIKGFSVRCLED